MLNDILFSDLVSLIEFIYMGEVRVKHQGLSSFLNTAEILRVRGLTEAASKQIKNSLLTTISENNNLGTTAPPRVPNNNLNNNNHSFSPTSFSQSYDTLQVFVQKIPFFIWLHKLIVFFSAGPFISLLTSRVSWYPHRPLSSH